MKKIINTTGAVFWKSPYNPYSAYTISEFILNEGDTLFLYTDGVPEATDKDNSAFGLKRMIDALNIDEDADPQRLITNVREKIEEFVCDASQFDDITMVSLKRLQK